MKAEEEEEVHDDDLDEVPCPEFCGFWFFVDHGCLFLPPGSSGSSGLPLQPLYLKKPRAGNQLLEAKKRMKHPASSFPRIF